MDAVFWIVLGVVLAVAEIFTTTLFLIMFGVEALEGATAVVLEPVDADRGMVKIDGELWTARSYDATRTYAEGERVQVIKVRGATALVWQDDISTPGELPEAKR